MAALARKGAVQEGCLVPLLGLRPQNGTDGRGVAPARPLGSGVTTILEDYPLRPLDSRRKGLRWTKQKLMTCHTQLNCLLCYAPPNPGLLSSLMPTCPVMYSQSTRGRQKCWLISLLSCLTFKKSLTLQTPQQSRVSCFTTILWNQLSVLSGFQLSFFSEGSGLLLRQVSPKSFYESPSGIQSGEHRGQADREPTNVPSGWYSLFGTEGTDLLVKEGSLQVPAGRGRVQRPGLQPCGRGCPRAEGVPVSRSPHPPGAPPPPGRSPQALPQSPTETSWSSAPGTSQLSASGWHPRQCCGRRKRKPVRCW